MFTRMSARSLLFTMGIVSDKIDIAFPLHFSRIFSCTSAVENCDEPPKGGKNETTMTRERFDCIFDELTPDQRDQRWNGNT